MLSLLAVFACSIVLRAWRCVTETVAIVHVGFVELMALKCVV